MIFYKKWASFFAIVFLIISGFSFIAKAAIDFSDDDGSPEVEQDTRNTGNQGSGTTTKFNTKLDIAENNPVAAILCKAIRAFTGTIAKIIAVFLLFGLGIALLSATPQSPVTPPTIVAFLIAIGILFSAETLLGVLVGDAGKGGAKKQLSCDCKYGLDGNCDSAL